MRDGEVSSKLVRKISQPDLIWCLSLEAHLAQPISSERCITVVCVATRGQAVRPTQHTETVAKSNLFGIFIHFLSPSVFFLTQTINEKIQFFMQSEFTSDVNVVVFFLRTCHAKETKI